MEALLTRQPTIALQEVVRERCLGVEVYVLSTRAGHPAGEGETGRSG